MLLTLGSAFMSCPQVGVGPQRLFSRVHVFLMVDILSELHSYIVILAVVIGSDGVIFTPDCTFSMAGTQPATCPHIQLNASVEFHIQKGILIFLHGNSND